MKMDLGRKKRIGKWIEYPACPENRTPVFRGRFHVTAVPAVCELLISGLGFYTAELNGAPVTDTLLNPAFSAYDKTVY